MGDEDFDINSAIDSVAESMNIGKEENDEPIDDQAENQEIPDVEGEEEAVETEIADDETEDGEEDVAEAVVVREAPKSWAKDQHEVWKTLPPAAQDYIEHRERQMLDGIEEYKQFAHYGRELNNVISPYSPMFEQAGIDIKTGVQYLLNAQ